MKLKLIILFSSLTVFWGCSKDLKKQERIFPVEIASVTQEDVPIFIEEIGNVYTLQNVLIRPQVAGVITDAFVQQGQYVKKGDPLYRIDPRPYEYALESAKGTLAKDMASLEFTEVQLLRNTEVAAKDFISPLTYEQYISQVDFNKGLIEFDKAAVKTAELNLEWCTPVSPLDGKVSQYNVDVGNLVAIDDPDFLIDIRQMDPSDIRFFVNQSDFLRVQEAIRNKTLKFEVYLPQEIDKPREGTIYFIDNHLDLDTGTILLKGTVPNEDKRFWPGEFIRVRLYLSVKKDAILVPSQAVKIGQKGPYIYVYDPVTSTANYVPVVKGEQIGKNIIIEDGIKLSDQVIIKGQNNLLPGVKVSVNTSVTKT